MATAAFHPVALRSEKSSCVTGKHSPIVQQAAHNVSQQLRASTAPSVPTADRPSLSRKSTTLTPSRRIYGLQHFFADYPSHPQCKQIKLLTAQQYYELQAQDLSLDTPESVLFPWIHGADQRGSQQACYFGYANKLCPTPRFRGLTVVHCDPEQGGFNKRLREDSIASFSSESTYSSSSSLNSFALSDDLNGATPSGLKGGPEPRTCQLQSTFLPDELLLPSNPARFQSPQLPPQVNLRNFRLQITKMATISDIVLYSAEGLSSPDLLPNAIRFLEAQELARRARLEQGEDPSHLVDYNVFCLVDSFDVIEHFYPDIVAVTSNGFLKHKVDYFEREKEEMRLLTQASPIADVVWLGNTQDVPLPSPSGISGLSLHANQSDVSSNYGAGNPPKKSRMASSDSSSSLDREEMEDGNPLNFSICIEAHDQAVMPNPESLQQVESLLEHVSSAPLTSSLGLPDATKKDMNHVDPSQIVHLECISTGQACVQSGSLKAFIDNLVHLVMWIRRQVKPPVAVQQQPFLFRGRRAKSSLPPPVKKPCNVLIHTTDGYTDTSVLALAYVMYDRACTLPQAYLYLQLERNRSFFVYPFDVNVLSKVEAKILAIIAEERRAAQIEQPLSSSPENDTPSEKEKPVGLLRGRFSRSGSASLVPRVGSQSAANSMSEKMLIAPFFYSERFDGHFPSRILPFLYLGNLNHASNALMLKELGITHVVSIGESALIPPRSTDSPTGVPNHLKGRMPTNSLWLEASLGNIEVLDLHGIADDGIDPIREYIELSNDFIDSAVRKGGKVLVHCRVGVSRSASLVIAYVMKHLEMDLQSAYLLVRSRRLNILIQPTVLFMWSLHWYEAKLNQERVRKGKKLLGPRVTWAFLAREMCNLNARYLNC